MKQFVFLLLFCAPILSAGQASRWRGTHQDGRYPDKNLMNIWPNDTLVLQNTYSGIGEGYGSPSITEDGIFVAGMHDTIGCVYRFSHSGDLVWQTEYGRDFTYRYPGSRGTPTVDGDKVYYSGAEGDVVCLDLLTGKTIWHLNIIDKYRGKSIKWGYTESVLVYNDLIILQPGGEEISLCALNKTNGTVVWEKTLNGNVNAYCSPKLVMHMGETLCMLNMSNSLLLFNPLTGEVKINHPLTDRRLNHSNEPIYKDGQIFYSSGYGEGAVMFKINDESNQLDTLWQNPDFDSKLSGVLIVDGIIYGTVDNKKQWAAIRWDNGETVFSSRDLKPGSFIMADEKFYIFTDNGEIVLAKPTLQGFDIISRFNSPAYPARFGFAHPAIYKGSLYIRFNNDVWQYKISE